MTTPTLYQRWSDQPAANVINDADESLLVQGGTNLRFSFSLLKTYLSGVYAPLSHVSDTNNPHSVTAAQTGADPAGTATSAVNAHDASGAAHGGVESSFAAHTSGQVNSHGQIDSHIASAANPHGVTAAQAGAVPDVATVDGDLLSFDGSTYIRLGLGTDGQVPTARPAQGAGLKIRWETPSGGGSGTLTTVRKNSGADVSTGRSRLNLIEGANVTIDISDDGANDEADITITSSAAGGGGGDMLSPATIAIGELFEAADTSGVQTARTNILASNLATMAANGTSGNLVQSAGNNKTQSDSGLAVSSVSGHIGSTSNPHSVTHAQTSPVANEHIDHSGVSITAGSGLTGGGNITATRTLNVGSGDGITVNADDVAVDSSVARRDTANTFAGNVDTSGSAIISEQGVKVLQPVDSVDASATIVPDLAAGNSPWIVATTTGAFTLNPPTSGVGSGHIEVVAASGITAGAFTRKLNSPPSSTPAIGFYTRNTAGETTLVWANGT